MMKAGQTAYSRMLGPLLLATPEQTYQQGAVDTHATVGDPVPCRATSRRAGWSLESACTPVTTPSHTKYEPPKGDNLSARPSIPPGLLVVEKTT